LGSFLHAEINFGQVTCVASRPSKKTQFQNWLILINANPDESHINVPIKLREMIMNIKVVLFAAALTALGASGVSAQVTNLSGQYRCVQGCKGGLAGPAYVTQYGWDLNLVNEVGEPSRAWVDWPGHIWAQYWNEGAVYSPDGMTIQFDNGSVWQRDIGAPTPPPPPAVKKVR
jgi:hypothetical protein